jgi:hypothetical protein
MLPICWVMAPVLGVLAQVQASAGRPIEDRTLQSTLFLAICIAFLGLVAFRVVIGRAIEEERRVQAVVVGLVSLASSVALIAYGVSTFT